MKINKQPVGRRGGRRLSADAVVDARRPSVFWSRRGGRRPSDHHRRGGRRPSADAVVDADAKYAPNEAGWRDGDVLWLMSCETMQTYGCDDVISLSSARICRVRFIGVNVISLIMRWELLVVVI